MEEKVVNMDDFKKEERQRKRKEKLDAVKKKASDAWNWAKEFYEDNKEFLIFGGTALIGGWKVVSSMSKKNGEKEHKENYIWDNRTGQYYRLRRPLKVSEQLELDRRRSEGESVGQILNSMRVL